VVITEFPWGNAGNQLISFTHGLYMAQLAEATFIVPHYMSAILHPFNLTFIRSLYCFREEWEYEDAKVAAGAQQLGLSYTHLAPPPPKYRKKPFVYPAGSQVMEIESEECFFLFKFLQRLERQTHPMLPQGAPSPAHAVAAAARHFVRVYCALWASPIPAVVNAAVQVVEKKLSSSVGYTAVHKRAMEGGCNKVMSQVTTASDFSPKELPMNNEVWPRVNKNFHPLCEMPAAFTMAVCALFYANSSSSSSSSSSQEGQQGQQGQQGRCGAGRGMFVAFDGRGDVSDYRQINAVFSSDVDFSSTSASSSSVPTHWSAPGSTAAPTPLHISDVNNIDKKFVDMFVAMMAEFFILNPRSTFSWEIYLIRLALGLSSVPVMTGKDLYVQHPEESRKNNLTGLWVSWTAAREAAVDLRSAAGLKEKKKKKEKKMK
jgi:hypothetical protein